MQADAVEPVQPDLSDLEEAVVECLRADRVRVPPYPAVAAKLQSLIATQDFGLRDVAAIVAADATLTATALRQANSAGVGAVTRVDNLETAVLKLGAQELARLALAATVGSAACGVGPLAELRREQWQSALMSAMLCQELAGRRGIRPDVAFMAGLLHDFGAVVVLACLEEIATERKLPAMPAAAWRQIVQSFHVEFGMIVATRWRLPDAIAECIASHHYPEVALRMYRPLVELVVVTDQIALALAQSPSAGLDALASIAALEPHERIRVGAQLPRLAEQMASFESPSPREPTGVPPSKVAREPDVAQGSWPIDLAVTVKGIAAPYRAVFLSPGALGLRGRTALTPNWLTSLTITCEPAPITMMVNVRSCDPASGEHLMSVQPFGLDGPGKAAWLALIASTRRSAGLPSGTVRTFQV